MMLQQFLDRVVAKYISTVLQGRREGMTSKTFVTGPKRSRLET